MPVRLVQRAMLIITAIAALVLSVTLGFADAGSQQPQPASAADPDTPQEVKPVVLSNRVSAYHISVTYDEQLGVLKGTQTVAWKNPGRKSAVELYFHLYPNAFAPGSTFLQETGGQLRDDRMKKDGYGSMELTQLTTETGETLLPRLRYVQPDDGNADDRTLAVLRLPHAVKPGETVTLKLSFTVTLPEVFARMGKADPFVMAGQWFPKIAAYEPATAKGAAQEGWNPHQYHGNSEFFADFGLYNVRINVPDHFTVAATGFLTKAPAVADGRKTYHFYADDVHDFAWSASPDFIYYEDAFSAVGVPGVRIKLYLDPLHEHLRDRYMHAAKSALSKLGEWYGDYPYSTLSIVVPPTNANGAGGMEYPTLVTAAAAQDRNPGYELERTLVHEIAHQYWYGLVATNEFEEAWLDEGFTSYTEDKLMHSIYGLVPPTVIESSYVTGPEALDQYAWRYSSSTQYAENVYLRGKLVLLAIEQQVGSQTMQKLLRAYFQKYQFKHPTAADFQQVVEAMTKKSWADFFTAYVTQAEAADYAVESIHTEKTEGGYASRVTLHRYGGIPEPVDVLFYFQDERSIRQIWDNTSAQVEVQLKSEAPLAFVIIDPSMQIVLDNRKFNNYLQAEVPHKTQTRWTAGIAQLLEGIFSALVW